MSTEMPIETTVETERRELLASPEAQTIRSAIEQAGEQIAAAGPVTPDAIDAQLPALQDALSAFGMDEDVVRTMLVTYLAESTSMARTV